MSICLNTLQVIAPAATTECILQKGFEKADTDDWGAVTQQFSFVPFVGAMDQAFLESHYDEIDKLWTNWISAQELAQSSEHKNCDELIIEFESDNEAAVHVVKTFVAWLQREQLVFDLSYRSKKPGAEWLEQFHVDGAKTVLWH